MKQLNHILEIIVIVVDYISVLILLYGVTLSIFEFIKVIFNRTNKSEEIGKIRKIRNQLGVYILYSLEVLIVADIIYTIINPSLNDIVMLAIIIIIRTVISFFLEREIKETK